MLSQPAIRNITLPGFGETAPPVRIAYAEWGDPSLPPLVCVHGLTRNGRDFDVLAQALSERFHVICPDMPGRGASQWLADPSGYQYPAYMQWMKALLAGLNITRTRWLGTSMGGIIGMMLAAGTPGLIQSLVLNDIGCFIPASGLNRILFYAGLPAIFDTLKEAENALRERCAPFGIQEEWQWRQLFTHSFRTLPDGRIGFACDPAIGQALPAPGQAKDVDLRMVMPALKELPVLLLRGKESDILPLAVAQDMQSQCSHLTLHEVPNTGHAPALMDQDSIDIIKNWLDSVG